MVCRIGLHLGLGLARSGLSASFSVSLTGLSTDSLGAYGQIGTEGSISYTITPDNGTETVKWSTSSNPADAATNGTGANPTAFSDTLYLHVTDGGETVTRSFAARYAPGSVTESAISDQTIDDDTWAVDFTGDFTTTNLTGSYVITGLSNGAVDDTDGTISGGVSGSPATLSPVVTFTDQYGRTIVGNYSVDAVYRAQATGGADLDLAFVEGVGGSQDLLANWTTNGNTLTLVSVSPALAANVSISSSGTLTATSGVVTTADATHTLTMEDEYGRTTDDTFTLEITAASGTITFTSGTYTRGAAGVNPTLGNTDLVATGTTGPYFLDILTVTNGTTPSQTDMDNGSGTGVLEKLTIGPQANIENLEVPIDLAVSVTNGRIYQQYRDSASTLSALTSTPVADTITYDAAAPVLSSANVNAAGNVLTIVFDKASYGTSIPAAFTLGGVSAGTPTLGAVSGLGTATHTMPITGNLPANGDTLTIGYNSVTGDLVGVDAEVVVTFSAQSVTNNVPGGGATYGNAISVDLGSGTTVGVSPAIGVEAYDNWQQVSGFPDTTGTNLEDDTTTSTTLDLTVDGSGNNDTRASGSGDTFNMFTRGLQMQDGDSLAFAQIPYAKYDIFLYIEELSTSVASNAASISDGTTAYHFESSAAARFAGSFAEITSTDVGAPDAAGNYMRWDGLTSTTATLTFSTGDGATFVLAGVQIVERTD